LSRITNQIIVRCITFTSADDVSEAEDKVLSSQTPKHLRNFSCQLLPMCTFLVPYFRWPKQVIPDCGVLNFSADGFSRCRHRWI